VIKEDKKMLNKNDKIFRAMLSHFRVCYDNENGKRPCENGEKCKECSQPVYNGWYMREFQNILKKKGREDGYVSNTIWY
jgi:hypothetical protein